MLDIPRLLAHELALTPAQIAQALQLRAEGGTVPFIARYRKERTGEMNETQLSDLFEQFDYLTDLEARRVAILASIEEQGKLTEELRHAIEACRVKAELEDLYLPYRPKKRTRATVAKEKGLEPLARWIEAANAPGMPSADLTAEAARYVSQEKGVGTPDEALAGAGDILAEEWSERADLRAHLRASTMERGVIASQVKKEFPVGTTKFEMYRDYRSPLKQIQAHNVLALFRGETQKVLAVGIEVDEAAILAWLEAQEIRAAAAPVRAFLRGVLTDAYRRLLRPAIAGDVRQMKKEESDRESILTFAANIRELLLASPAGMRPTLGVDPGFRTGCKTVVIDRTGKFIVARTLQPHKSAAERSQAAAAVRELIREHAVELIAIGNGTASRETDLFVAEAIAGIDPKPVRIVVSEAGASVYSASKVALSEFPDLDVTVRGAISIGRRLQDPLAELVKIDPRSIGVGQYQHDVDQKLLRKKLEETVESCVNYVGVDVNTASRELLRHVAGVTTTVADNIVAFRNERGPFRSRAELREVPKLGPKTFEQAAGFLRIRGGDAPLDGTAVHPESYEIAERIVRDLHVPLEEIPRHPELLKSIDLRRYVTDDVGEPTLRDILDELQKPGRDPRASFIAPAFNEAITDIKDLRPGMVLEGIVTNVANFGAFVDIGVHQDGLVHVSQLADRFVKDPKEVVRVGQIVTVRVLEVQEQQKRIGLSMKREAGRGAGVTGAAKGKAKSKEPVFTLEDLKARFNSR
jgi:uncharacterized protein